MKIPVDRFRAYAIRPYISATHGFRINTSLHNRAFSIRPTSLHNRAFSIRPYIPTSPPLLHSNALQSPASLPLSCPLPCIPWTLFALFVPLFRGLFLRRSALRATLACCVSTFFAKRSGPCKHLLTHSAFAFFAYGWGFRWPYSLAHPLLHKNPCLKPSSMLRNLPRKKRP